MTGAVSRNFGTMRGLVRLGLSYGQSLPFLSRANAPAPCAVKRLVFVCHGNICRSAFAEGVARDLGLATASFGLSTSSGKPAHEPARELAEALGHPIEGHLTTRVEDFVPQAGDYLLCMEHRHLAKLAGNAELSAYPRGLLGQYAAVPVPHLHDPYQLDPAYMEVCFRRIETAVNGLSRRYRGARLS